LRGWSSARTSCSSFLSLLFLPSILTLGFLPASAPSHTSSTTPTNDSSIVNVPTAALFRAVNARRFVLPPQSFFPPTHPSPLSPSSITLAARPPPTNLHRSLGRCEAVVGASCRGGDECELDQEMSEGRVRRAIYQGECALLPTTLFLLKPSTRN
jgi:hypothetical protein